MQISFYVLGDRYASHDDVCDVGNDSTASVVNAEAVLNFVCKLTQTVLRKSEHSLVIVDSNSKRLQKLDTHLWSFDSTSFIPHNLHLTPPESQNSNQNMGVNNDASNDTGSLDANLDTNLDIDQKAKPQTNKHILQASMLTAPVSLVSTLPQGFDGVVLNLASKPLSLPDDSVIPERILEIITPDDLSKQQGREKYKYYQGLGYELLYFPIN